MHKTACSIATLFTLLLTTSFAAAHDEPNPKAESKEGAEKKGEGEKEAEPAWELYGDVVGGATTTEVLTPGKPTRIELPPANIVDSTRVTAYAALVGVERHLGERFAVGLRMPFLTADLRSRTGASEARSVSAAGNLELEGSFVIVHGATWNLVGQLGVALPTSGGTEPPTAKEVADEPEKRFDYKKYDTFAALHAASAMRGSYDSALFETGNLGIIPQLSANFQLAKLKVTPSVKVENLIAVQGEMDEQLIVEVVGGVRASYRLVQAFEPGVHLWVRELHEQAHTESSSSGVAVVEPFVRFPLGAITPMASAILPFAGDLADNKTFGVRVALSGEL
jgi:hypothetical protein